MSSLPGSLPLASLQPLPPLREGFFRSLCPFCLFLSARVFRLVCIPYIHAAHSPSLSRYLKTPRTGSGFILLPSLSCQRSFFPLSPPPPPFSAILSCFTLYLWEPLNSVTVVFPLGNSCTVSTESSWGTLPDGKLPVCWQRDNGGDRQGTTQLPAKGTAGDITIKLWPWSRITATPLPPRSLVPTPNAKVTTGMRSFQHLSAI